MKNKYSVSMVLPMFNERESIESTIRNAVGFLSDFNSDSEIIVVDDGSTDGSLGIVKELSKKISFLEYVCFNKNRGLGRALRAGFNQAENDFILYTDSDWPVDSGVLRKAFDLLVREKADLVVGCRNGKRELLYRRACSFFYNLFVKAIFGLKFKDVNCPLKLVHKKIINDIILKSDGPFIDVELLVRIKNKGYKIIELSYPNIPRKLGKSKFNSFGAIMKAMKSTFIEIVKFTPELLSRG